MNKNINIEGSSAAAPDASFAEAATQNYGFDFSELLNSLEAFGDDASIFEEMTDNSP